MEEFGGGAVPVWQNFSTSLIPRPEAAIGLGV